MRFSRNLRKWLAACTLCLMLLGQHSVAAYACSTSLQDMAHAAAAMPDCEETATLSVLCLKHCESGNEAPGLTDVAGAAIAADVLHYFVIQTTIAPPAIAIRQHYSVYAPSPPLIVRLQRFLI